MGADKHGGRRAVFLDRDGVINRNILNPATGEYEAPLMADDFEFLPGVLAAMCALRAGGFPLFLVSNQPNYAKGKSTRETLRSIHRKFLAGLARHDIKFARFYYCFHHPEGIMAGYSYPCGCRKPSPHFLLKARADYDVDLGRSWMVGDRLSDIQCGHAAGTKTILIGTAQLYRDGEIQPDEVAPDLLAAAKIIVAAPECPKSLPSRLSLCDMRRQPRPGGTC
jgi:D-glycero-D-manno-heptose 1,7-bisphosphate phosphatase